MKPVSLDPNQPLHFYRGGEAIARLRGQSPPPGNRPEDWLASTTARFGSESDGLTVLPCGWPLGDAVAEDPVGWLGPDHAEHLGADTYLLVKLLDAGERLPVHVHPDRRFARQHLGLHHGKTEAWVVVEATGAEPCVYLGFVTDIDGADLRRWVDDGDTDALVGALHCLSVAPGDSVLVPAGTPHAIGAGIFCIELQEPTDLSVMLEGAGARTGAGGGHLGLGYDMALECVQRSALPPPAMSDLWRRATPTGAHPVDALFAERADPFFRAQRLRPDRPVTVPASFAVTVTLEGEGTFSTENGVEVPTRRGDTILFPHACGAVTVSGAVDVVRCLPPRPEDALKEAGT